MSTPEILSKLGIGSGLNNTEIISAIVDAETIAEKERITRDEADYSNNTNIYPIKAGSEDTVKELIEETQYFTKQQMMNIICECSTFNGILPEPSYEINGVKFWSGKKIISLIIPKHINLTSENAS